MDKPRYLYTSLAGLPARRKAAGYTQERLAAELGLSRQSVISWEGGSSWPSAALLPVIADLLLCSIDELYVAPETGCNASETAAEPQEAS